MNTVLGLLVAVVVSLVWVVLVTGGWIAVEPNRTLVLMWLGMAAAIFPFSLTAMGALRRKRPVEARQQA